MSDREFLLMEAVRRLNAVYCQLWGCMCENNRNTDRAGEEVFTDGYKRFTDIMERLTGEAWAVVELKPAAPTRPDCPPPRLRR